MAQALFSLDAPRLVSGRAKVWQATLVAVYVLTVAVVWVMSPTPLAAVPAVGLAHALIGAFVSGVTALLMFSHARATGRRGYLIIAATFLYLSGLLLVFPLFFPGGLLEGQRILGTAQSAPTLYYSWHLAFPLGLAAAAWVLYSDQQRHRRPGLKTAQLWWAAVAAALGVAVTVSLVSSNWIPSVIEQSGAKNGAGAVMDALIVVLSLGFVGVSFYCARTGAVITRWLAAMALLALGEALVNLNTDDRFTLGWYASRMLWLVAVSGLLLALIWNLSRVDRANAQLATVDALTGADSRRAFLDSVHRELARSQVTGNPVAMLWLDLDGFKEINDQLGHPVGDEVLRRVVQRLVGQVRLADQVGRLGGDEFGVLLCDYGEHERVVAIAQRLLGAVRRPIVLPEGTLHVTAAIGIATAPEDAHDAEQLLQCADLAMYAAKKAGGDMVEFFTPRIGREAFERAQLRQDLAVALRAGDFTIHYQPVYEAGGGRMAAVEMLARWEHDGQVVAAAAFAGFAEGTGQIVPIGRLLLRQLAQDMPRWLGTQDADFFVSVNLSVKELADHGLIEQLVTGPLSQYANRIVIEVTESLELQESAEALLHLERIHDAGLRIAIDDFGAGFSNFTRLEELRPSLLKIDRSLVRRAGSEVEGGVAFLTAATSVAASLGCDVVAEGVETAAEAQVVQLMGVRYVQGYRYAKPAPIDTWLTPTPTIHGN